MTIRTRVVYCPWNDEKPFSIERMDDSIQRWWVIGTTDDREAAIGAAKAYLSYPLVIGEFTADAEAPSALPVAGP